MAHTPPFTDPAESRLPEPARTPVADVPDLPGCESFPLAVDEIERHDDRIEYWNARDGMAWRVRDVSSWHEQPGQRLAMLAARMASVRGAAIECFGSTSLARLDAAARNKTRARLRELNERLLTEGSYRVTTLASYQHNMWMTARGIGLLLVFAVGIAETASGRTTPGTLAAFVLTAMLLLGAGVHAGLLHDAAPAAGAVVAGGAAAGRSAGCAGWWAANPVRRSGCGLQQRVFRLHRRP